MKPIYDMPVSTFEALKNAVREANIEHLVSDAHLLIMQAHLEDFISQEFTALTFNHRHVESLINVIRKRYQST